MKMMSKKASRQQGGMALIDYILALILILLAVGGVYAMYAGAESNTNVNSEQNNITQMRADTKACYAGFGGDYTGLTTARAVSCGAFPENMLRGQANPTNTFNGAVTITVGGNAREFDITENNIPGPEACLRLAGFMNGQWVSVSVNGTDIPQDDSRAASTAAQNSCNDNNNNTIIYTSN